MRDDYIDNEISNTPDDTKTIAQQLLNGINTSFARQMGQKGLELLRQSSTSNLSGIVDFLNTKNSETPNQDGVKAHLNWMMLEGEELKLVNECSGFVQVPVINAGEEKKLLQAEDGEDLEITKSGYIYIFVSNSSNKPIRFDDLFVKRIKSALVDETHYYPFGLSMSGISSKAASTLENKNLYNGIEFDEDLGLNIYEAFYRHLDPQTGRWWEIDPEIENGQESLTPYNSMSDNPILRSDFLGDLDYVSNQEQSNQQYAECCPQALEILVKGEGIAGTAALTFNPIGEVTAGTVAVGTLVVAGAWALWEIFTAPSAPAPNSGTFKLEQPIPGSPLMMGTNSYAPKAVTATTPPSTTVVQAKKGPKDLKAEAEAEKAKREASAARTAKREEATSKGNQGGNSNQQVKGDHNTNTSKKNQNDHDARIKRAKREQAAAAAKREASKKKKP